MCELCHLHLCHSLEVGKEWSARLMMRPENVYQKLMKNERRILIRVLGVLLPKAFE